MAKFCVYTGCCYGHGAKLSSRKRIPADPSPDVKPPRRWWRRWR